MYHDIKFHTVLKYPNDYTDNSHWKKLKKHFCILSSFAKLLYKFQILVRLWRNGTCTTTLLEIGAHFLESNVTTRVKDYNDALAL